MHNKIRDELGARKNLERVEDVRMSGKSWSAVKIRDDLERVKFMDEFGACEGEG